MLTKTLPVLCACIISAWAVNESSATTYNVANYGAIGDSKIGYNCAMTSDSPSLVCQDVSFASTDEGRQVAVYGATDQSHWVALNTTIQSVKNASTVTLATAASRTVSATMAQIVGRDNVSAVQNAVNAGCKSASAGNPSTVNFPNGIYAVSAGVQIPAGCIHVSLEAQNTGGATLLGTYISSWNSSNHGYGQGGTVLFFGSTNAPGTGTNALSDNVTIAAGTNVLTCSGCNFNSSDEGQPIYVEYAGANHGPLWSTIASVVNSSEVTLEKDAETSLPLNPTGLIAGPAVVFGYDAIENIDVGGINIQNLGYYYEDGFTTLGVPLVEFGAGSQIVKQEVSFHDSTLISATNGCTGNNGPNDGFTMKNLTCEGAQDTGFYLAGFHTNGTIENVVVDNTRYPIPTTAMWNGFLLKGITNVTIENATVRCYCKDFLVDFGDLASFNNTIENSNLNGEEATPVGIGSNLLSGLTITNTTVQGIAGNAFRFVNAQAKGITGITMTSDTVLDSNGAIWTTDGSNTGHGPANMQFKSNTAQVSGNAITIQDSEGTNYWTGNDLTETDADQGWAWAISQGASGATNYIGSNTAKNFRPGTNSCDSSCKPPPSN